MQQIKANFKTVQNEIKGKGAGGGIFSWTAIFRGHRLGITHLLRV